MISKISHPATNSNIDWWGTYFMLRFHLVPLAAQKLHAVTLIRIECKQSLIRMFMKDSCMNFIKESSSLNNAANLIFSGTRLLLIRKYILFEDFKDARLTMGNGLLLTNVCAAFQRKWKHLWNAVSALGSCSYVLSSGGMRLAICQEGFIWSADFPNTSVLFQTNGFCHRNFSKVNHAHFSRSCGVFFSSSWVSNVFFPH